MRESEPYKRFDRAMTELLKCSHDDLKAALDAEKAAKAEKKRKAKESSASGRASRAKD